MCFDCLARWDNNISILPTEHYWNLHSFCIFSFWVLVICYLYNVYCFSCILCLVSVWRLRLHQLRPACTTRSWAWSWRISAADQNSDVEAMYDNVWSRLLFCDIIHKIYQLHNFLMSEFLNNFGSATYKSHKVLPHKKNQVN